ncbi:MAG TPA: hypothetical protein VEY89_14025 [Candidatus Dormibacteraeota bacterium]|nr:hypothetical protein [Candidatus Dormibacteraeota bacterium]
MIAHILTGSPVPLGLQWLAAVLLFGGLLAAFALRGRAWRVLAAALAVLGFGGTAASWALAAVQPGAPPYGMRIIAPRDGAQVASPVTLTVCGVRGDGSTLPATDAAHYLVVTVDGHEVPTVDQWQFAEPLALGMHSITVELVTPAHHVFSPPTKSTVHVRVVRVAPTAAAAGC